MTISEWSHRYKQITKKSLDFNALSTCNSVSHCHRLDANVECAFSDNTKLNYQAGQWRLSDSDLLSFLVNQQT